MYFIEDDAIIAGRWHRWHRSRRAVGRLWGRRPLVSIRTRFGYVSPGDIDGYIARALHSRQLTHFHVHTRELPHYRFVDLYRAVETFCQGRGDVQTIASEHEEDLNSLLHCKRRQWPSRVQGISPGRVAHAPRCPCQSITSGSVAPSLGLCQSA